MAKPGKKKKLLFVLEIVVLLLFIGGLYVYGQISSRLDKIEQPKLDEEKIMVNQEAPKMTGYKTYVLFGIDSRGAGSQYSAQNSDTMIIVSVNNDTKEVRMASIYRDTLLNIGDDTYTKANAAYARGSAEQAISMLNTNLDLDISDYATADFSAMAEVIDDLGGLDIPMSYAELVHMNNYCVETSELTGREYTPIELPEPKPEDQETEGGMFVEADCNLASGEALVRQFMHGKKFFRDEFGTDNKILWLPDVFGYSWALPQILKRSGIESFMTIKISWNQYNHMPHDTFRWIGVDGSEVLTHL